MADRSHRRGQFDGALFRKKYRNVLVGTVATKKNEGRGKTEPEEKNGGGGGKGNEGKRDRRKRRGTGDGGEKHAERAEESRLGRWEGRSSMPGRRALRPEDNSPTNTWKLGGGRGLVSGKEGRKKRKKKRIAPYGTFALCFLATNARKKKEKRKIKKKKKKKKSTKKKKKKKKIKPFFFLFFVYCYRAGPNWRRKRTGNRNGS